MTAQQAQIAPDLTVDEVRVRTQTGSAEGGATFIGAAAAALGLVWLVYQRVLPFSGVLGFWVCWYVMFLAVYYLMARMQWDGLEAEPASQRGVRHRRGACPADRHRSSRLHAI